MSCSAAFTNRCLLLDWASYYCGGFYPDNSIVVKHRQPIIRGPLALLDVIAPYLWLTSHVLQSSHDVIHHNMPSVLFSAGTVSMLKITPQKIMISIKCHVGELYTLHSVRTAGSRTIRFNSVVFHVNYTTALNRWWFIIKHWVIINRFKNMHGMISKLFYAWKFMLWGLF